MIFYYYYRATIKAKLISSRRLSHYYRSESIEQMSYIELVTHVIFLITTFTSKLKKMTVIFIKTNFVMKLTILFNSVKLSLNELNHS
jgi:uncharacterized membrane protein YwzB